MTQPRTVEAVIETLLKEYVACFGRRNKCDVCIKQETFLTAHLTLAVEAGYKQALQNVVEGLPEEPEAGEDSTAYTIRDSLNIIKEAQWKLGFIACRNEALAHLKQLEGMGEK